MNKLALVRRLAQEAGISGTITTVDPGANIQREHRRASDWIDSAYAEILGEQFWRFLWEQPALTLAAGAATIAGTIPASRYLQHTMRSATGELSYVDWQHWQRIPAVTPDGQPWLWTVRPDNAIAFNQAPLEPMALTVERYRLPDVMAADTDTPLMPARHHEAIVWQALVLYANFEEAGSTRLAAVQRLNALRNDLAVAELPAMQWGAPLC